MHKLKIGILTLPLHTNYGGVLQAFALQTKLQQLGHDALVLNVQTKDVSYFRKVLSLIKQNGLSVLGGHQIKYPDWVSQGDKKIIAKNTEQFIEENIKRTASLGSIINFSDLQSYNFDTFIVGSDQVWRPQYVPYLPNYFFDFLKAEDNVKKISYAASFGVDSWLFSSEQTKKCAVLAKKFTAVSVRESSAIQLCENKLGVKAIQMLDPVLLLSKDVYIQLINKKISDKPKGNLMTYILDKSTENKAITEKISKELDLVPFAVMPQQKDLTKFSKSKINEFIFPPVTDWLNGFYTSEFVITDSFHGTLFAIIFNKPFISIGNTKRGLSRFQSILNLLGLEDRLVLDINEVSKELIYSKIDYGKVNLLLDLWRTKSVEFIKESI